MPSRPSTKKKPAPTAEAPKPKVQSIEERTAYLEDRLKGSQVSFEIQPRVFYEGFPKKVLYVQDVKSAQGAAVWKGLFMADLSDADLTGAIRDEVAGDRE